MALNPIEIRKHLPQTDCRDCAAANCLMFAMQVFQKKRALDECPHVTEEAKAALAGEAAPPMKTLKLGAGERVLEIGGETVLFRHDETFHHPCGLAVIIPADDPNLAARIENATKLTFDRVGRQESVNLIAIKDAGDAAQFAAAAKQAAATGMPLILRSSSPEALKAAAAETAAAKPILYGARADNLEAVAAIAKEHGLPLVVSVDSDLGALADLSQKVQDAGVADLILDSGAVRDADLVVQQSAIRRAAIRKKDRRFGFPTIVWTDEGAPQRQVSRACLAIAKYAGLVAVGVDSPETILPLITARLNIYTDPQKPIQITGGLYQIGEPGEQSPVLVTTNFSLTYFTVEGDVMASKVPSWCVVVDTEGTSVLTAWAAEKFTAESIAKAVEASGVAEKVGHKKLVIPGGVAVLSGKLEEASGWKVQVGPRESSGIPPFLRGWSSN